MRKNLCFTPLLILLSLALGACDSDSCNEHVCIAVAPAELTLEVGRCKRYPFRQEPVLED